MVDRILRLTWRRVLLVVAVWIACVVLHNIIYALFQDAWGPRRRTVFLCLGCCHHTGLFDCVRIVFRDQLVSALSRLTAMRLFTQHIPSRFVFSQPAK
jgi:hypothetical protein